MKSQRQTKIMEIIASKDIETQEQLLEELRQAGFHSTQATISRDIKELRILKDLTAMGTYRYSIGTKETSGAFSNRLNAIFKESVISYDYAQNIVVVKTLPGLANGAASALDGMDIPDLVGTLAAEVMSEAITRAITSAETAYGFISATDFNK